MGFPTSHQPRSCITHNSQNYTFGKIQDEKWVSKQVSGLYCVSAEVKFNMAAMGQMVPCQNLDRQNLDRQNYYIDTRGTAAV